MPLTKTGRKIMRHMQKSYGKKKGTRVFYASMNAGNFKGVKVHRAKKSRKR